MCLDMAKWQEMARVHACIRKTGPGRMAGRIAVVTGDIRCCGREVARLLYREGASVVVAGRDFDLTERTAEETGEDVLPVQVDERDERSVAGLMARTVEHFGGLDLLVSAEDMVQRTPRNTRVNCDSFERLCRYAALIMKAQHSSNPAAMYDIIMVCPKADLVDSSLDSSYNIPRFGGIHIVEGMALDLMPSSIKVNAICPERRCMVRGPASERAAPLIAEAVVRCAMQQFETGQFIPFRLTEFRKTTVRRRAGVVA